MYGVILEQSNGCLMKYALDNVKSAGQEQILGTVDEYELFSKANLGVISSNEIFNLLGFDNAEYHMKRYIENYLTLDKGFIPFAEKIKDKYDLVLLSNDVSEWSRYTTEFYGLNKYFKYKSVSAEMKCRKPDFKIFDLTLEMLGKRPAECIFVDNRTRNLLAAEEVGISPILFDRDGEHYYGVTVNSFEELYQLIGK